MVTNKDNLDLHFGNILNIQYMIGVISYLVLSLKYHNVNKLIKLEHKYLNKWM